MNQELLQSSEENCNNLSADPKDQGIIRSVIQCLIWIPYFIYSQRVVEIFTKIRKKNVGEQEEILAQPKVSPPDLPVIQK